MSGEEASSVAIEQHIKIDLAAQGWCASACGPRPPAQRAPLLASPPLPLQTSWPRDTRVAPHPPLPGLRLAAASAVLVLRSPAR